MMQQCTHEDFMREAIRLSLEGMRKNAGGPFGAVVVQAGEIIGRGHNSVIALNDPTAHAEVMAIRDACKNVGTFKLENTILYTSCEPCPMCMSAVYWAHIGEVFYGNTHQLAAAIDFDDAMIYQELSLPPELRKIAMHQILTDEASKAFQEWIQKSDKTPY